MEEEPDLLTQEEWEEYIEDIRPDAVYKEDELEAIRHDKVLMYYAVAGVPERYHHLESLKDVGFVHPDSIREFEREWLSWYQGLEKGGLASAGGFYLYGQHNSGKTSLAVLAMLSACDFVEQLPDPFYLHTGTFVSKRRVNDPEAEICLARAAESAICVLDDVGSESASEFAREQLTVLLEARVGCVYPTIYTGNIDPEDLEATLGGRIAARIIRYNRAIRI